MRDIKFRAWDKNRESMWSPDYFKLRQDASRYYIVTTTGHGSIHDVELMQYTGLKDKNGVEIYEGDILSDQDSMAKPSVEVYWHSDAASWWAKDIETPNSKGTNLFHFHRWCEVIGNIYESPELLK